jgi:uncharacterized protein (TIGR02466 family)
MNNIIHPFSLPIYQDFINKEFFDIIKEDTYQFISKNKELFKDIWYCPTKTTQGQPKEKNIQSKILENQIKHHIENYLKIWNFKKLNGLKITEIWVNIAEEGSYQEEHNHGSNLFSGVVYIDTNESSGDFQFLNPLSTEHILMHDSKLLPPFFPIKPQNNMIVLFPGWLNHRVLSNKSNKNRISISFNIQRV